MRQCLGTAEPGHTEGSEALTKAIVMGCPLPVVLLAWLCLQFPDHFDPRIKGCGEWFELAAREGIKGNSIDQGRRTRGHSGFHKKTTELSVFALSLHVSFSSD